MSLVNQLMKEGSNCADNLAIMLGFTPLESELYFHLIQKGEKTITQLCNDANRKQNTIPGALQTLVTHGICNNKKKTKLPRGYEVLYTAIELKHVQTILKQRLERLYDCTTNCIKTYSTKA